MSSSHATALEAHRRRLKERGLARIEVQAPRRDAALLRALAKRLREETGTGELRRSLAQIIEARQPRSRKALLSAAPLEGLNLERSRELPREIDL